jgi:hypothetical protein
MIRRPGLAFFAPAVLACALGRPSVARACGGCFHPAVSTEKTVVTDHRMAFAVSPTQTVLWDQIHYSGNPAEFAWVLPVRQGARIELSNDAWFAALDASTEPVILIPPDNTGGGTSGCALMGCGSSQAMAGAVSGGPVQVVSQSVVGPYETVTLRATDPNALLDWLTLHGFAIQPVNAPMVDAYVSEGFDFIALRLRPQCNEQSMQPVRVITPGATPTLPLRMVAAGVGASVGITLYVITEGRMHPQNFPDAKIDYSRLSWSLTQQRSNYQELSVEAMATANGGAWITEYADQPQLVQGSFGGSTGSGGPASAQNPGLADAYFGLCTAAGTGALTDAPPCPPPQPFDAGGETDAAADGSGEAAAADAAPPDASPAEPSGPADCPGFDDMAVALNGMHTADVRITRLRAFLPVAALGQGDLVLEAAPEQGKVTNVHQALGYSDYSPGACASAPKTRDSLGTWSIAALCAIGLGGLLRRRMGE